jgi:hypothetical protein
MQPQSLSPVRISVRDILQKDRTSIRDGESIYVLLKSLLHAGCRVELSLKGIDVDAWFFDEAICRLYGDFPESVVDGIEIVDMRKVDTWELRDAKELRKLYYYDRPAFDERMRLNREWLREEDPSLLGEDCDADFVPDPGDPEAPGTYGRWIDRETGEEYFI